MSSYRLVIFDMDGTILDTLTDLSNAVNHTLKHFGYPERTQQEIRSFLGNGSRYLIEKSLPANNAVIPTKLELLLDYYNSYYKENCAVHTKPYKGIWELLLKLKHENKLIAVVSNKPDFGVQELCQHHFPNLFDFACGERTGIRRKPAPDSVQEVMQRLKVAGKEAVYIGDSEVDISTAQNAGLEAIIVTWGFRDADQLIKAGAPRLVSSIQELEKILL